MFEKFTSVDARDFATRYQGTYGFFYREGKKKFLSKLEVVDQAVRFVDARGIPYELLPDSVDDTGFEFLPPKAGYSNTDIGAILVQRKAQKQFSRGISERNTSLYLIGPLGHEPLLVSFKNLSKVYESNITPQAAWEKFINKEVPSVALGTQFALTLTHLYVLDVRIGKVLAMEKNQVLIELSNDLFKTEIRDNFRNIAQVTLV